MKKHREWNSHDRLLKKLLRIMKLTSFLILVLVISVSASSYSQNTKLNIQVTNGTFVDVLKQIEKQSEFYFYYNNDEIRNIGGVSITISNKNVEEVLNQLLKGTDLEYQIIDRYIALKKKSDSVSELTELQQQKSVTGKVTDSSGSPLPGVSVVVKGTTNGTITDADGNYSISNIPENATLQFSFVGMKVQEVVVVGKTKIDITMDEDAIGIEEVVAVGYGTQKKGNLTGSIANVKSEKLTIAPVASTTNALGGQLPGLIAKQTSGQPGADAAALSIRGFGSALVIVDGIESSLNNLDANQIESVSILKDGSASIYGARAGNGVILVTTKRGNQQKPTITLNSSMTYQGVTKILKPASSGQRSEMEREEWLQAGKPEAMAPFSAERVQKYYDGTDPLYPNTDWYNEIFRDWAPQLQHNLSVKGGSDKIKYYGFIGYLNQETIIKTNGGDYNRYNLQSNIDAKITDNLSLQLDIASNIGNSNTNVRGMGIGQNMWQDYWQTLPYYPAHLPDPTKVPYAFGAGVGGIHVTSNKAIGGYSKAITQDLKGTISLNYKIKAIKGLSAKAFVNYFKSYNTVKGFSRPVDLYSYDPTSKVYTVVAAYGTKASLNQGASNNSVYTQQYSLNYDNTFNDHHITALALYESIDYKSETLSASRTNFLTSTIDQMFAGSTDGMANGGSASEMGRKSYVGRLNYDYKSRYLLETIIRADASAKFPSDKRLGYFPSVSLGWVVSQEGFMKQFSKLDNLKLRASYGESGNDAIGNFQYLSGYAYGITYLLGGGAQQGISSTSLANSNLTWERMKISNLGVDFSLMNRRIYGEADVFYRERSGILTTRITSLPTTFGASLPPENINSLNDRGFELNLGTVGKLLGEVSYDISANISWSRSKWDHYEEPEYTDPDQLRLSKNSGRWTDRIIGYKSDGLFTSQSQIDALTFTYPQGNSTLRPGDIRYVDVNGDKILNWKDQIDIGMGTTPHWMAGFNANLKYKNFDLSALFQGASGYYTSVNLAAQQSTMKYESRWTSTNNDPNALIPRLGGASSNGFSSDYMFKESGYIRLKIGSLGYNLPKKWLDKIAFSQVRIYTSGTNLFTWNKLNKYGLDPEAPNIGSYYPQQRTISFGLNASF